MRVSTIIPCMKLHMTVSVPFLITVIDVAVPCGSKSNIILAEFIWENARIFAFKMYAIVCVPSGTPTVLYLNHHAATSGGLTPDSLYKECLNEFKPILWHFICECTGTPSCKCNVCLRQAPSLRSLASHTVFRLAFNLSEIKLTRRTLYHQYLHAVKSDIVPLDRLIPITFPKLHCTYLHGQNCDDSKNFSQSLHDSFAPILGHILRNTQRHRWRGCRNIMHRKRLVVRSL